MRSVNTDLVFKPPFNFVHMDDTSGFPCIVLDISERRTPPHATGLNIAGGGENIVWQDLWGGGEKCYLYFEFLGWSAKMHCTPIA